MWSLLFVPDVRQLLVSAGLGKMLAMSNQCTLPIRVWFKFPDIHFLTSTLEVFTWRMLVTMGV